MKLECRLKLPAWVIGLSLAIYPAVWASATINPHAAPGSLAKSESFCQQLGAEPMGQINNLLQMAVPVTFKGYVETEGKVTCEASLTGLLDSWSEQVALYRGNGSVSSLSLPEAGVSICEALICQTPKAEGRKYRFIIKGFPDQKARVDRLRKNVGVFKGHMLVEIDWQKLRAAFPEETLILNKEWNP